MRKKDVLTTGQVAQLCKVAPRTVTKWFDSGQLRGYRIPGSKDRRIPLSELIRFMKAHDMPTDNVEKGKIRILIIDSRAEKATGLADQLCAKGSFDIHCAHNSFDAGLMALKHCPNIIIIDLMSNGIDAHQLCTYVRSSQELKDTTVIAMAGGLSEKEAANLVNRGFSAVITDCSSLGQLVAAIQKSCSILN